MRSLFLAIVALAASAAANAQAPQASLADITIRYVQAQEAVMQRGAGKAETDALLAFYTEDYTYYHPQYGAKVTGRDSHRNGVESHLGETADARIVIDGLMVNGDMVTVSTETRFTVVGDGKKVFRPGFWVLTFRDGKIAQRVDVTPLPLKPAT
jgi:ketosteroid isomerase-like protein